jgi:hypothetical protein
VSSRRCVSPRIPCERGAADILRLGHDVEHHSVLDAPQLQPEWFGSRCEPTSGVGPDLHLRVVERVTRIELAFSAWEADFAERGRAPPNHSGWSDGVCGRRRTASGGSERGINAGSFALGGLNPNAGLAARYQCARLMLTRSSRSDRNCHLGGGTPARGADPSRRSWDARSVVTRCRSVRPRIRRSARLRRPFIRWRAIR